MSFLTYGDQLGLTKLEIVLALEEVVLDAGLYEKAKAKIEERAKEADVEMLEHHADDYGEDDEA